MTTKIIALAVIFALLQITTPSCQGKPNPYKTIDAVFTKVASHQYGQKYVFFAQDIPQQFSLIRVWGNSYQAGFAYGSLMKKQLTENYDNLWKYYYEMAQQEFHFITKVPQRYQPLARTLAIKVLKSLLMWNHYITRPYTPKRFLDEYAGISAGSGLQMHKMIEINMIPEYTRAGCSILGAWGKATVNQHLVQLRALDWDVRNPMNKYPILVVYNLNEKGSHPFVNIGFTGIVGSITGFSEYTGVSEKVRKQNPVKQNQTRYGKPWTYAVRDLLQFSQNIEGALQALNNTRRTCSIYLGVGNAKSNAFRLVEYSHKQFKVYDDNNFPYTNLHQKMQSVVFMPIHDDNNGCFNDLIKQEYGNINAEWMVNVLAASHKTGDTHMVAFDYNTKELFFQVSYISKLAFQRPSLRIQMADFLKF